MYLYTDLHNISGNSVSFESYRTNEAAAREQLQQIPVKFTGPIDSKSMKLIEIVNSLITSETKKVLRNNNIENEVIEINVTE